MGVTIVGVLGNKQESVPAPQEQRHNFIGANVRTCGQRHDFKTTMLMLSFSVG